MVSIKWRRNRVIEAPELGRLFHSAHRPQVAAMAKIIKPPLTNNFIKLMARPSEGL